MSSPSHNNAPAARPPNSLPTPLYLAAPTAGDSKMAPLATPEICINDVAFDESDCNCDGASGGNGSGGGDPASQGGCGLNENNSDDSSTLDLCKRQWRRSSWCPEEEKKKEEKHEKQRMILAIVGKR